MEKGVGWREVECMCEGCVEAVELGKLAIRCMVVCANVGFHNAQYLGFVLVYGVVCGIVFAAT